MKRDLVQRKVKYLFAIGEVSVEDTKLEEERFNQDEQRDDEGLEALSGAVVKLRRRARAISEEIGHPPGPSGNDERGKVCVYHAVQKHEQVDNQIKINRARLHRIH